MVNNQQQENEPHLLITFFGLFFIFFYKQTVRKELLSISITFLKKKELLSNREDDFTIIHV
jgi:hypothetical protein